MTSTEELTGRALDAAIATEAMGWTHPSPIHTAYTPEYEGDREDWTWPARIGPQVIPHYSTSIADAWLVVEKLVDPAPDVFDLWQDWKMWYCSFFNDAATGMGKTAPEAICRAALTAVRS